VDRAAQGGRRTENRWTEEDKTFATNSPDRIESLRELLKQRIVIIDGAMGTMIQAHSSASETIAANNLPIIPRTCGRTMIC